MKPRRLKVVIPILLLGLAVIGYAGYRGYGYFAARPSLTEGEAIAIVQEKVREELETAMKVGASTAGVSTARQMVQVNRAQLSGKWLATPEGDHWLVSARYWSGEKEYIAQWELYSDSKLIRSRGAGSVISEEDETRLRQWLNAMSPEEREDELKGMEGIPAFSEIVEEYRTPAPRGWTEEIFGGLPTWVWGVAGGEALVLVVGFAYWWLRRRGAG